MAKPVSLKVDEVGAFVRSRRGQGRVVSVHAAAINVRWPDGLLMSIVEKTCRMTSLSLCAPSLFQGARPKSHASLMGNAVALKEDSLLLDGLCLDMKAARLWEGLLPEDQIGGCCREKVSLIREALLSTGRKEGLLGMLGGLPETNPFVRYAFQRLEPTSSMQPGEPRLQELASLIGLGPGFTPSGDDFITGVLAGERIGRTVRGRKHPVPAVEEQPIRSCLWKTNDAGRTLLWMALQGHFPGYLVEAVKGLAGVSKDRDAGDVVADAAAHGETSGTDALAGLVWYLENFALPRNRP